MSNSTSIDNSNLLAARRLLEMAKQADARRSGKTVKEKSALEYMQEDQALISAPAFDAQKQEAAALPQIENINVNLSDLRNVKPQTGGTATVSEEQSIQIEFELRYRSNTPLDGLLIHDRNYAESDRYLFKFADGATFTILDKWTSKSTTVWGDPHVDVDDVQGNSNGDFKDLKASDEFTTFMLSDGTRVTFKARDAGIIEQVDIFKGSQHVRGIGQAAEGYSPESGLFLQTVLQDGKTAAISTPPGDTVLSGGDGNDWYDSRGNLVWGKTTGPVVTQRPNATLEFMYRQTVSQSVSVKTISKDA